MNTRGSRFVVKTDPTDDDKARVTMTDPSMNTLDIEFSKENGIRPMGISLRRLILARQNSYR